VLEERTLLSPGDLDPTFGNGGFVTTSFSARAGGAGSVAVQTDGRIVVAGTLSTNAVYQIALARYNADGSLDGSFGSGGQLTSFPGRDAASVAIQTDGRIIVAGGFSASVGASERFALARYNTDGTPDRSFGIAGQVTTEFLQPYAAGKSLALQTDGRIIVTGYTSDSSNTFRFALARYDGDGSLDASFGSDGLVTTSFPGSTSAVANSVAGQADGDIVVGGVTESSGSSPGQFAVARYTSDGRLDDSFGIGGLVTTDFPDSVSGIDRVAVQADGRIVTAGTLDTPDLTSSRFALARYDSDGTLDRSFGTDGVVTTSFPGFLVADPTGLAVQANGRIVVSGTTDDNTSPFLFALARYNSDGNLDSSFGTGGRVTTSFPGFYSAFSGGVALQADGKILVAGSVGTAHFLVARYEGDPIGATHFAISAPAEVTAGQPFDVTVSAVDDNGNVVPDYAGTVTLTSTDPQASTLDSHTFTTGDGGTFTFSDVQLFTAGPQSLVADDGTLSGQANLTVDPGVAVALLLSGPDQVSAGVSFVVTLTAYDAFGNQATGYRGAVSFVSTDPAAQLPVDYAFTSDDAGRHDFTITLNSPGPVRLTAIDTYALTLSYLDLTVS
jgi:uncharacterized delta-60 repeat protein